MAGLLLGGASTCLEAEGIGGRVLLLHHMYVGVKITMPSSAASAAPAAPSAPAADRSFVPYYGTNPGKWLVPGSTLICLVAVFLFLFIFVFRHLPDFPA